MYKIVCANSYFVSVPDDEELWKSGICFVGVIKTVLGDFVWMDWTGGVICFGWIGQHGTSILLGD